MRNILLRFFACAVAVAVGASVVQAAGTAGSRYGSDYFPNVDVLDQDGRKLKFYDDVIRDKIVLVSFIYTSCRDICPLVTARLAQVQERLGSAVGRDVFFVSISIDPENDTPQRLKEHAEAFHAGPGWLFITGRPDDIKLINYKLGERSRSLTEHRNEIVLGNDRTGDWARDSAFTDMSVLAMTIQGMDPEKRREAARQVIVDQAKVVPDTDVLPGQALYARTCAACHTLGKGARVGPDLLGVTGRRDRAWLANYMIAPERMRAAHDPIAVELMGKYKNVRMPTLGLSENDASDLVAYLEFQTYRITAPKSEATRAHERGHQHGGHSHNHSH